MHCALMVAWVLFSACVKRPVDNSDTVIEDTDINQSPESLVCLRWGESEPVGQVEDATLVEISGLAVSSLNPGVLWVLEDSGAQPILTALDGNGISLGVLTLSGVSNADWEDLAVAPCGERSCLWVGEFGDNGAARDEVAILRVEEPDLAVQTDGFSLELTPVVQRYTYPEGPQDAEALVIEPDGTPVVLTKRMDATSRIYRIPFSGEGVASAVLVTTISTGPDEGFATATTAADSWPGGGTLLVRGYFYAFELDISEVGLDAADTVQGRELVTAIEGQAEAIAYDPLTRAIWHVSEGETPILYRVGCLD